MFNAAESIVSEIPKKRELTPEERRKREARHLRKKAAIESNNVGKRLMWIREKLSITHAEIERATDIPMSTYNDWETNIRTGHWEAIAILSIFLNELWVQKYKESFPIVDGEEIKEITPLFIMFGEDLKTKELSQIKSEYKERMEDMIFELEMKKKELRELEKRQLNILDFCSEKTN